MRGAPARLPIIAHQRPALFITLDHVVRVTVVSRDNQRASGVPHSGSDAMDCQVDRFDRHCRGTDTTGMPDHVRVGKVEANEIRTRTVLTVHFRDNQVYDFVGGHLRLKVIGRNLRAVGHQSTLTIEWNFSAATEKEGDMRVFFRFSDAHLGSARIGNRLPERGDQIGFVVDHVNALK